MISKILSTVNKLYFATACIVFIVSVHIIIKSVEEDNAYLSIFKTDHYDKSPHSRKYWARRLAR